MFVIEGDVQGLRVSARRLRDRGVFFADVSRAVGAVDAWGWSGAASDVFRERFRVEPSRWGEASWAFEWAGEALDEYADVLERCQVAAAECGRRYAYGVELNAEASADWRSVPVLSRGGLVMPKRPGDAVMAGAERDFARVVADLNAAGDECARALRVACADAPQERSWWDEAGAFVQGALEAGADYAKLLFFPVSSSVAFAEQVGRWWDGRLNASEVVALQLRPIEMMGDLAQAGWNDPRGTGLAALAGAFDVQTWLDDPARAAGRLAPDAVIGAATGGVGAAANKMGKLGLKADQIHAGAKALNRVHHFPFNRRTTSFPEFRAPRPSAAYTENVTASGLGVKHALPQASHHPSPHLHAEDAGLPRGRHPHPDPAFNQGHENPHAQRKAFFPTLEERLNPTPDHTPEPVKTDDIRTNSVTSEGLKDDVNLPAQREEPTKTNDDTPVEPRPNTTPDTTSHTDCDTTSNTDSAPAVASDETPASDSTATPNETQDTDTDSPETETAPEAPASTGQPNADTPHTKETPDSTTLNNTDSAEHAKPEPNPASDSPTTDQTSESVRTDDADNTPVDSSGKGAEAPTRSDEAVTVDNAADVERQPNTDSDTSSNTDTDSDPAVASDETPASDSTATPNETQDTDTDPPETETAPEAPASTGQPNADTPHTKETPDSTTPNNTDNAEHAKPEPKADSDPPTTDETPEPIRTDDADNNTVADAEKESGALAQTDGPSDATTNASTSNRDINDAHPFGDNEANSIAANDQAKPSVDAGPANESAPAVAPLDGAESAPVYDPHSTQPSTLPTLKSEEEIAALTRPNNISDANYALLRKDRGLAPTGPDSIERVLRNNWDESLPPEEIPRLRPTVRGLIKDIGEVFGRDEHGNLLSYNQWWDLHNGPRTFWPETGMEVPHHPSQPEHLVLAPGITEPPETHTFVGGAYKETVTDWGGPGVKAQEDDIIHVQGTAASLFNQFRTHYGLPEDSPVLFDRIGYDNGEYLALIGPDGPASVGARSIAPPSLMNPYTSFRVNEDNIPANWTMRSGITAPWHGGYGGAIEIFFFDEKLNEISIETLLEKEILHEVEAEK